MSERLARLIDELRAAEAAGAEVFAAWGAVSALQGLRGGLATIAAREATHAELLAERLDELGAPRQAVLPDAVRAAALACFGSAAVSDDEKLAALLERYPDAGAATRPLEPLLDAAGDDVETREILRLIAAAESATVSWLRAYHSGLAHAGAPPAVSDRGA